MGVTGFEPVAGSFPDGRNQHEFAANDGACSRVDAGGIALVHQEQPRFMCRSADVPYIAEDDYLIISSVNYRVVAWISDGTGVTTIHLEKQ